MSILYAESSAILRWLLGHPDAEVIRQHLAGAREVLTSAITTAEVMRTLQRLGATGNLTSAERAAAWAAYRTAVRHWKLRACDDDVLARTGEPFPREPVRTLDGVHLATALLHDRELGPVAMLSTDDRVRDNASAMGLTVVP